MKVISKLGDENIATVFIAQTENKQKIEFVESVEPPISRDEKWVNIVSTLFGCPAGCSICDAGSNYSGKLSAEQILFQIDYLVQQRYPDRCIPAKKWKIQFARMGEPAFNPDVLKVLRILPDRYNAPGLMPSISTIAPRGVQGFFDELEEIHREMYVGHFQFQFSIHSTDETQRRKLIPARTWNLSEMAEYGERFFHPGDRKIALNFALIDGVTIEPGILRDNFDPDIFIIKLTPLNPTFRANKNQLSSAFGKSKLRTELVSILETNGYEVIVSLGELEENAIGSNCGQYVSALEDNNIEKTEAYSYEKELLPCEAD